MPVWVLPKDVLEHPLGCKRFFESRTDLLDIARLGKYSGLTTLLTIGIEA